MTITSQDSDLIASIIREEIAGGRSSEWLPYAFADALEKESNKFDRKKFLHASRPKVEEWRVPIPYGLSAPLRCHKKHVKV